MVKVLISDKMSPLAKEIFERRGIETDEIVGLTKEELEAKIHEYDGLAIRSATKVTPKILAVAKNLKVVGRAGIGVDNVDIPAATSNGTVVMNTPMGNSITTAEHAIAMMFAVARQIPQASASTHQGKWEKSKFMGTELKGKTLGIVGFGNIGQRVAEICNVIGMHILTNSNSANDDVLKSLSAKKVSTEELLSSSDVLSLHTKLNDQTSNMLNKETIATMKKSSVIINCARGGLINESDLKDALNNDVIAGAAIDVYETEPATENVMFGAKNLLLTPHLGASSKEAQSNVAIDVANQVADFLKENKIVNNVNSF